MLLRKRIITFGTIATVVLTSTFTTNSLTVSAERSVDSLKTEQKELNQDLSKVETKIKDILLDIEKIHKEIVKLEDEIKQNKTLIADVEKEITNHETEIEKINNRIDERNEILKNRIASFQHSGGNVKFLEVLLGSKSPLQFISRIDAVTTMTGADQELIEEQEADLQQVELKVDELDQMKADLEGIHDELEYDLKEEEKAKKKIAKKEKELKKEKEKIEGDLQSVNSEIASLEAEIRAEMNRETETAAATTRQTSNNNSNTNNVEQQTNNTPKPTNIDTSSVLGTARSALGKPYLPGGNTLSGFDCSGYVKWVFDQHGVSLPRTAAGMASAGQRVSLSEAKPGDLAIFRNGGHVGIYLGNGSFIGSQTSTGVAVASLSSGYWAQNFNYIVRVN